MKLPKGQGGTAGIAAGKPYHAEGAESEFYYEIALFFKL